MKKVLLVSAMVIVAGFAHAQLIPKAGVTLTKIAFEEDDDMKSRLGFTLGVAYNIEVNDLFSVQPELNFLQKGFKTEYTESETIQGTTYSVTSKSNFSLNYIEIPVLAKLTFGSGTKFYFNAGPSLGFGLGGKIKNEATATVQGSSQTEKSEGKIKFGDAPDNANDEDAYLDNRIDVGLQIGLGVLVAEKVMIDLRYGHGLTNLDDADGDDDSKSQNRVIQFTVGIPLSLGK